MSETMSKNPRRSLEPSALPTEPTVTPSLETPTNGELASPQAPSVPDAPAAPATATAFATPIAIPTVAVLEGRLATITTAFTDEKSEILSLLKLARKREGVVVTKKAKTPKALGA